jgi:23S rRNA G2069 N7-methylase RlmK/C1962 C5-methylase RlmI
VSQAQVEDWANQIVTSLQIPRDRLFVKRRTPGASYEKVGETGARFEVSEGGLRFLVNLQDYVDTGLFLDHRQTRAMVRAISSGKRVLNLFSYTGSFSVYAAAGNASRTLSVDLSPTYTRWAGDNLSLNGFATAHDVVVDDVLTFLRAPPSELFDIVVLDPPTVSKSKRADSDLDVQRDHLFLIERSLSRLSAGGVLFFSTNLTNFAIGDVKTSAKASFVDEMTQKTVPPDFTHRPPPHRCFRIEK